MFKLRITINFMILYFFIYLIFIEFINNIKFDRKSNLIVANLIYFIEIKKNMNFNFSNV